jgi:hypothetical protein
MENPEIQPLDMTAESPVEAWLLACPSKRARAVGGLTLRASGA